MMNKPNISIIVPAYNTCDVINRTLKSIEAQTYNNYEVIIINDGSTDGTKELLDEYKKDKLNVIVYHQKNQGVSAARNKGIELSSAELVCFLDSDDTYDPNFLALMIKRRIETNGEIIYCGYNMVNIYTKIAEKYPPYFEEGDVLPLYYTDGSFIHVSGMIINKSFLLKNNLSFEVGRKISEDLLFSVKCFSLTKVYAVNNYLLNYFYRKNSTMNSIRENDIWISDLDCNKGILEYVKIHYHSKNKNKVLQLMEFRLFKRELEYIYLQMIDFKFNEINYYIKNSNFLTFGKKYHSLLPKGEYKKYNFIYKQKKINLIIGALYYKFFRVNFKKNNKN